jgi:hypothetical protein
VLLGNAELVNVFQVSLLAYFDLVHSAWFVSLHCLILIISTTLNFDSF